MRGGPCRTTRRLRLTGAGAWLAVWLPTAVIAAAAVGAMPADGAAATGCETDECAAEAEPAPMLALMPPPDAGLTAPSSLTRLPLSVHVRVADGVCERLLERGVAVPTRVVRLFTTTRDDQAAAHIELYAGERPFCEGNRFLALLQLAPLPTPSYRSFVQLELTLEAHADGTLSCEVLEVESRALGEPFCEASWRGDLLDAVGAPPEHGREGREVALFSHALAKHLPVLLATRTVRLGDRDIVIRQHQKREEEKVGTGGVLWEAAIVLSDYVGRNGSSFAWQGSPK